MGLLKHLPVLVGTGVALLLVGICGICMNNIEQRRQLESHRVAQGFSSRLLDRFNESLGAIYLLANSVDRQSGKISQFEEQAAALMLDFPFLRALELAPAGVITHVFPLRGNEVVLGHDLLTDKSRNREVHQAISRRQLAIAGPVELRQGGVGVIARYPLYLTATEGRSRFWGLSIAVIDFPLLMRAAGDLELERMDYRYQFCWIPAGEANCQLAIGDQGLATGSDTITVRFGTAQADWRLLLRPREGWLTAGEYWLAALLVLLGSLSAAWGGRKLIEARAA